MKKHVTNYHQAKGLIPGDFIACEICGCEAVDIHHIESKGMGGSKKKDSADNLIALCRLCHMRAHSLKEPYLTKGELYAVNKNRKQEG